MLPSTVLSHGMRVKNNFKEKDEPVFENGFSFRTLSQILRLHDVEKDICPFARQCLVLVNNMKRMYRHFGLAALIINVVLATRSQLLAEWFSLGANLAAIKHPRDLLERLLVLSQLKKDYSLPEGYEQCNDGRNSLTTQPGNHGLGQNLVRLPKGLGACLFRGLQCIPELHKPFRAYGSIEFFILGSLTFSLS